MGLLVGINRMFAGISLTTSQIRHTRTPYDGSSEGRFKRYLAVMGATSVTAAALVAGFNLLVDPLRT